MKYEFLEDEATADIAIVAYGKTMKQAFENVALAVINVMVDPTTVEEQEIKYVTKTAKDLKALLYDFLEDIVYYNDAENLMFKTVKVEELDKSNNTIKAVFKGEPFDSNRHEARNHVKAITYFGMEINKTKKGCVIKVTLDL